MQLNLFWEFVFTNIKISNNLTTVLTICFYICSLTKNVKSQLTKYLRKQKPFKKSDQADELAKRYHI